MSSMIRNMHRERERRVNASPTMRASYDALFRVASSTVIAMHDETKPAGPPSFRPISVAVVDYITRKRLALKSSYFRQTYGRDYWTGTPRRARSAAIRARRDSDEA